MTVAITRLDLSSVELRERAARSRDSKASRRLLAIAMVLEGWPRQDAAAACAMDRQTLRDWVHRYNDLGPEGLHDQPRRNGSPSRLSVAQQAQVAAWVAEGPDLQRDGVVRWRCVDLQRRIQAEFAVTLHETTIGRLLRRLNFTRLQPRPYHPKKDASAHDIFKKTSPAW